MCIEDATALQTNNTHIMHGYKAGEGVPCYSRLINLCLAPPLRVKLFKKPQNSELQGFLLQVNLEHKTLISTLDLVAK